jgi:hypothetical protein
MAEKKHPVSTDYPLLYAFSVGDRDYYRFENVEQMPAARTLGALKYYTMLRAACDTDYLSAHVAKVREIYQDPKKIRLDEIIRLNEQMAERLEMLSRFPPQDMVYRYASVIYFDDKESPYHYDEGYQDKKIESWKKNLDTAAFFLQKSIVELVPSFGSVSDYSQMSSLLRVTDLINLKHLQALISDSSPTMRKTGFYSRLLSLTEILSKRTGYEGDLPMNTSLSSRRSSNLGAANKQHLKKFANK